MLDLPALRSLWRERERVVVLQAGFGTGETFLRVWQARRDDAQRRASLHFIVIEPAPPDRLALLAAHAAGRLAPLAHELSASWPPLTRNLHRLAFDGGEVQLLLAMGEVGDWLPELQAQVDVFLIDAVALPDTRRGAAQRLFKALARLAAAHASLHAAMPLQAASGALRNAGFQLEAATPHDASASAGTACLRATYRPHFVPRRRAAPHGSGGEHHALIVGAGLAGCALACALAEQGWQSTLLDRRDAPASEGSGNPAGLFHGIVNVQDGAHARFNRAAALQAHIAVRQAIDRHGAKGSTDGLLRLETSGKDASRMRAELRALRLPDSYVMALDAAQASARCGLRLDHPAWYYPGGGWVQPAALARSFLQRAGAATRFLGTTPVQSLQHIDGQWTLHDEAGRVLARAATVVLANAADALRLLDAVHWPVERVRGQISLFANAAAPSDLKLRLPSLPLAGAGWLLPEVDGWAVFGASARPGNADDEPSASEHEFNLLRLRQLSPLTLPAQATLRCDMLSSQVGWRCVAADRLPLIGAVPDEVALAGQDAARLRDLPRRPGLYVFSALASRGITWSALGAQILAARIAGAPVPLEASLVDALDPARFALRAARRQRPRG